MAFVVLTGHLADSLVERLAEVGHLAVQVVTRTPRSVAELTPPELEARVASELGTKRVCATDEIADPQSQPWVDVRFPVVDEAELDDVEVIGFEDGEQVHLAHACCRLGGAAVQPDAQLVGWLVRLGAVSDADALGEVQLGLDALHYPAQDLGVERDGGVRKDVDVATFVDDIEVIRCAHGKNLQSIRLSGTVDSPQ